MLFDKFTEKINSCFATMRTKPRAILQALCFGTLAGVLISHPAAEPSLALTSASAMILYFGVLFLSEGAGLITAITFCLVSFFLATTGAPAEVLRLSVFALLFAVHRLGSEIIPPILILCYLWMLYLFLPYFPLPLIQGYLSEANMSSAIMLVAEASFVMVFGLLVCSDRGNALLGQKPQTISIKLFCTHLLAMPVILAAIGVLYFISSSPLVLSAILSNFKNPQLSMLLILLGVIIILSLAGLQTTQVVSNLFSSLTNVSNRDGGLFDTRLSPLPIREFLDTRTIFVKQNEEIFRGRKRNKELALDIERKRRELEENIGCLLSIKQLIDGSPWGCLAVRLDGTIVTANHTFFTLLGLDPDEHRLKEYGSLLTGPHPWVKEVVDNISWACWKYETLLGSGHQIKYSQVVDNYFLEMVLDISTNPRLSREEPVVQDAATGETMLALVFLRKIPDIRDFQLRLLSSGGGELSKILDEIPQHRAPTAARVEPFNLSFLTAHTLDHLFSLLGLGNRPDVTTCSDLEKLQAGVSPERFPISEIGYIRIYASAEEVDRFLSLLLCLVKNIMPKKETLSVSLDYEFIGSGTADIITGSAPGRYARLVISHPGQSIAAYMVSSTPAEIQHDRNPLNDTALALFLLRKQVKHMGGFISVQSTVSKGTTVTIYLPEEVGQVSSVSEKLSDQLDNEHLESAESTESTEP